MDAFGRAFDIVVGHEGGLSAEPSDPGNWTGGAVGRGLLRGTMFGISAASYPMLEIAALSLADAQVIYKRDYWTRVSGDDLPPALALLVFDAAVNNGVGRAVRWLQACVEVEQDGIVGPRTLAALSASVRQGSGARLCAEFMAQRTYFMTRLPTWSSFGLGWSKRLCSLPYQSMSMSADTLTVASPQV